MKLFYFVILSVALSLVSCKTQQKIVNKAPADAAQVIELNADGTPKRRYNEDGIPILLEYTPRSIDLGKVKKGEKRNLAFEYKNTSNEDVEIEIVTACSCTETDFTVTKMKPGEGGKILLVFDSTTKEDSETIDVDVILKNTYDEDYPVVDQLNFKYELIGEDGKPYVSTKKGGEGH